MTHAAAPPAVGAGDLSGSPLAVLRRLRAASRDRDWREVVDEARGSVRSLWRSWSPADRRRFLRHLRPWWDVRRHRMAPPVARQIAELVETGALVVAAGAIQTLGLDGDGVQATWRPRGSRLVRRLRAHAVINCTGHQGGVGQLGGLLAGLADQGLIRPDACRLGVEVDDGSRLIGADGTPAPGLYAVGPITRGAFWEMTSVPDIRGQAQEVGREILAALGTAVA